MKNIYHRIAAATCGTITLGFCVPQIAVAQTLFVTSDRTIAGGNPINDTYDRIAIGFNGVGTIFPGVRADIIGGSTVLSVNATTQSIVNISGGTFGTALTGSSYASALALQGGSTVSVSNGTFNGFAFVGSSNSVPGPVNTLNFSGGTIPDIYALSNSVVNMTGGSVTTIPGNTVTGGILRNQGNGIINLSGGSVDVVRMSGINPTAQPDYVSTTNISGGTVGRISAEGDGILNFIGNGLSVSAGAQYARYDPFFATNAFVRDYTVTGTLSSGAVLDQTFTAAADYTETGTLLSFRGSVFNPAQDLYVESDQILSDVYNYVTVGYDEEFSVPSSPTIAIANGADVGTADLYNDTTVLMTGGVIHGIFNVGGTSDLTVTGGTIGAPTDPTSGIVAYGDGATVSVLGGTVNRIEAYNSGAVTIGGTAQVGFANVDINDFIVTGGSVEMLRIGYNTGSGMLSLLGGSTEVVEGWGGTANIRGGLAGGATLANVGFALSYTGVDFNLFGTDLFAGNPTIGTYFSDVEGDFTGVWWDLTGTLENGSLLTARYFDADGTTAAPARLNFIAPVTVPEPGSVALLSIGFVGGVGGLGAARRRKALQQRLARG